MAMIDFAFGDQRRIAELYLSYLETGGPARVSGYSSFTMVMGTTTWAGAQVSHHADGRFRENLQTRPPPLGFGRACRAWRSTMCRARRSRSAR
jgi:hypothetical protein